MVVGCGSCEYATLAAIHTLIRKKAQVGVKAAMVDGHKFSAL